MRRALPGLAAVAAAVLLPWTTGGPRHWFDPHPDAPGVLFWLAGLIIVGALVAQRDGWLGAFVAWTALSACWAPKTSGALGIATLVALGAVGLVAVRSMPAEWRRGAAIAVSGLALSQVAYQLLQWWGIDPLWPGRPAGAGLYGTMANRAWLGALLAVAGTVAPLWALPGIVLGLLLAQSKVALLALAVGLLVAWRSVLGLALALISAFAGLLLFLSWPDFSARWRLAGWRLGLATWWEESPALGLGPGTWWSVIPHRQDQLQVYAHEHMTKAHNEFLQVLFEGGVVALVIVLAWMWAHRADFVSGPHPGALVTIAVLCLAHFPFRVAQVTAAVIVVMGLATAPAPGGSA